MATKLLVATESLLLSGEDLHYFRLPSTSRLMDRFYHSSRHQENWSRNYRRPLKQGNNSYSPLPVPGGYQGTIYENSVSSVGHSSGSKSGLRSGRTLRDNYAQTETRYTQGITLRPEDLFRDCSQQHTQIVGRTGLLAAPRGRHAPHVTPGAKGGRRSTIAGNLTEPRSPLVRRSSEGNTISNNDQVTVRFFEYRPPEVHPATPAAAASGTVQSRFSVDSSSSWSGSSSLSEFSGYSSSATEGRDSRSQDADSSSFSSTSSSSCSGAEAPSLTGSEPDSDSESLSSRGSESGSTTTSCCCRHDKESPCTSSCCPRTTPYCDETTTATTTTTTADRSTSSTNITSTNNNDISNAQIHRTTAVDTLATKSESELSKFVLPRIQIQRAESLCTVYNVEQVLEASEPCLNENNSTQQVEPVVDAEDQGGGNVCDGRSQGREEDAHEEGEQEQEADKEQNTELSPAIATSSTFPEEYELQDLTGNEVSISELKDDVESSFKDDEEEADDKERSRTSRTVSDDSGTEFRADEEVEGSSSSCFCEKSTEQENCSSKCEEQEEYEEDECDIETGISEADCSMCLREKLGETDSRALSPDVYVVQPILGEEEKKNKSDELKAEESAEVPSSVEQDKEATKPKSPDFLKPDFDFEPEIVHKGKPIDDEGEEGSSFRRMSEEEFIATLSIHDAARKGDMHVVKLLVKKNPKQMETVDERGWTPIHLAAAYGHADIVKYLALEGAHIAALDPSSYTAIHIASMNGHNICVETLLQMGADVDCVTAEGFTPLHLAVMNAHLDCCQTLLHWGASLDKKDALGRGVHEMVEEYNLEEVARLICNFRRQLESFQSMLKMIKPITGDGNTRTIAAAAAAANTGSVPKDVLDMLASIAEESGPE